MPYVVTHGEVHLNGVVYRVGDALPAMKGDLSDVAAIGAVEWRDSRKEQAKPARTQAKGK